MAKVVKKGSSYFLDYYDEHGKRVIRKFSGSYDAAKITLQRLTTQIAERKFLINPFAKPDHDSDEWRHDSLFPV